MDKIVVSVLFMASLLLTYMTLSMAGVSEPLQGRMLQALVMAALALAAVSYLPIANAYDTALATCRHLEELSKRYDENEKRIENILYEYDNRIKRLEELVDEASSDSNIKRDGND